MIAVKPILKKIGMFLVVWGKPIIKRVLRENLKKEILPMLQDKIDLGKFDKEFDEILAVAVDEVIKKHL